MGTITKIREDLRIFTLDFTLLYVCFASNQTRRAFFLHVWLYVYAYNHIPLFSQRCLLESTKLCRTKYEKYNQIQTWYLCLCVGGMHINTYTSMYVYKGNRR